MSKRERETETNNSSPASEPPLNRPKLTGDSIAPLSSWSHNMEEKFNTLLISFEQMRSDNESLRARVQNLEIFLSSYGVKR